MKETLNSPEKRLKWILKEKKLTAYALSKILNYKSPDTIYHILNGKNKISVGFAKKLEDSVLKINIIAEIMQQNKDEGSVMLPFLGKDGAFREICNS